MICGTLSTRAAAKEIRKQENNLKGNKMPENPKAANFGDLYLSLETNFDIECQLINFDVTKHNPKGNRYQDCVLYDGQNQEKAKIWEGRNGLPLENKNLNQWLTYNLSARAGTGKWADKKFIGGFWDSSAAIITNPPQAQQAPQRAAGATKYQQPAPQSKIEPDWDAIAEGKVRHGILCAMLQGGIQVDYEEVLRHTVFVMTGIDPDNAPEPHKDITEQDGICAHCGKPHHNCSCNPPF